MPKFPLDDETIEELLQLRADVNEKLDARRAEAAATLLRTVEQEAERLGISIPQLLKGARGGRKSKNNGTARDQA